MKRKILALILALTLSLLLPACGSGGASGGSDGGAAPSGTSDDSDGGAASGDTSDGVVPEPVFVSWEDAGLTDHVMEWGDYRVKEEMEKQTGITGRDIMLSDVWELQEFSAEGGISDISALGELTNLTSLRLSYIRISDISALSDLTNLRMLTLSRNEASDLSGLLSVLSGLTNLEHLSVERTVDTTPVDFVPIVDRYG